VRKLVGLAGFDTARCLAEGKHGWLFPSAEARRSPLAAIACGLGIGAQDHFDPTKEFENIASVHGLRRAR
jgi:hypothetical protein